MFNDSCMRGFKDTEGERQLMVMVMLLVLLVMMMMVMMMIIFMVLARGFNHALHTGRHSRTSLLFSYAADSMSNSRHQSINSSD